MTIRPALASSIASAIGHTLNGGGSGGAAPSLLLDDVSPVTVLSAGRRLLTAYTGPANRIRRASDDGEVDINYVDDLYDTTSLAAHCPAQNGYVRTIYDQSGLDNHQHQAVGATQLTAVSSGTPVGLGGKFIPVGSGATQMVGGSYTLTDFTVFGVVRFSAGSQGVFNIGPVNRAQCGFNGTNLINYRVSNGTCLIACPNATLVQFTAYSSSASRRIWLNGVEGTPSAVSGSDTIAGETMYYSALGNAVWRMAGYIAELIIIPGLVADAKRVEIENSQRTFWGTA